MDEIVGENNVSMTNNRAIDKAVKERTEYTTYANVVKGNSGKHVGDRIVNTKEK